MVTADVLAFPPQFKPAVMERLASERWSADQVMLLPSHTHTSFDMMALHPGNQFGIPQIGLLHKELFSHTADKLATAIREARRQLTPVVAGTSTVAVPDRNRNRRSGLTSHDTDLRIYSSETMGFEPTLELSPFTDVGDAPRGLASRLALEQNYPNPFWWAR